MRPSFAVLASGLLLGSAAPPPPAPVAESSPAAIQLAALLARVTTTGGPVAQTMNDPAVPEPPPLPTPERALRNGVLIVVSLPSQQLFVFRDGELWDSTKVSTGKRGHETPTGAFPILQKKVHHRSSLYNDAPMPYMQRLTWDGVALHAGALPGYPASHGCIRLPKSFAKDLYKVTNFTSSVVLVTDEPVTSPKEALGVV